MDLYSNPNDQRIYDIEYIKEHARQDYISDQDKIKLKKKRKQALVFGIVITGFLLVLLYILWMFMKTAGLAN